jgi:hypothetical protein
LSPRPPRRALGVAGLALALATACTPPPPPSRWQRPDVGPETTREVELDCRQHAVEAIVGADNQDQAQGVHQEREAYFDRCMRGSGFELR